jgi:hypothetical protein
MTAWVFSSHIAIALLILFGLRAETALSQNTCRRGASKTPHQQSLFQDDFPNDLEVEALCDGTIDVKATGEICITGRVSYRQLAEAIGTPIRAPASDTISVTGHLITGSGNVVLGTEANFLYDFVTSYTVNGTTFAAGASLADNVFAASRGLINGLCLDRSFTRPEEFYATTHDFWLPKNADEQKLMDANIIFASRFSIVAEYHKPSNFGPYLGTITNTVATFFSGIVPSFVFKVLPLLAATGIFRLLVIGTASTAQIPQPLQAPDVTVENVQIDTEWLSLVNAMSDGLFTVDKVPLYMGVVIKKIEPLTIASCWSTTVASIDIQAPMGKGDQLDQYVKDTVLPALKNHGKVGLHFGKRLDSGSEILSTALSTYNSQCGVQLNLSAANCYHPACNRASTLTNFTYPPSLYQPARQREQSASDDLVEANDS